MNLQALALKMAEKVKSTGKPAAIGQMNAHDRRIVHIALQDDKMVRTQSKGEGFLKKLVIFPKKNSFRKQK
jgi:spoIIIJ-associated protein